MKKLGLIFILFFLQLGLGFSSNFDAKMCIAGNELGVSGGNAAQTGGKKAIVIGEDMTRIKIATKELQAQGIDAKWYQAWGKYFKADNFDLGKSLSRNQAWIESKIQQGYNIYDIGPKGNTITSPFYKLEIDTINNLKYPTIHLGGY